MFKHVFSRNNKYFSISVYVLMTCIILGIFIKLLFFWSSASDAISNAISTLSPFIFGLIIAFLINPLVNSLKNKVLGKIPHLSNRPGTLDVLSILLSYVIIILAVLMIITYVVPQIVKSIGIMANQFPSWISDFQNFLEKFSKKHPNFNFEYIQGMLTNANVDLQNTFSSTIKSLSSTFFQTGVDIVKFIINFVIAFIVSCYLISDKKIMKRGLKRFIYAVAPEEKAKSITNVLTKSAQIFSGFFFGKLVDSIIIGFLTFVVLFIPGLFGVPGFKECAIIIGVVVGLTNMIPYVGPFMGAVPSILLICIYSPKSAILFLAIIILIQQIDGNLIGPRILGNSTGLRPIWIIFAITIGGWIGGILGMLLAVPTVAVISSLMRDYVDSKLCEKGLDMPSLDKPKDDGVKADKKKKKSGKNKPKE